jgi:hypothetical protein
VVEIAGAFALSMFVFATYVVWLLLEDARARTDPAFWGAAPGEIVIENCRVHLARMIESVAVVRDLCSYALPEEYREAA